MSAKRTRLDAVCLPRPLWTLILCFVATPRDLLSCRRVSRLLRDASDADAPWKRWIKPIALWDTTLGARGVVCKYVAGWCPACQRVIAKNWVNSPSRHYYMHDAWHGRNDPFDSRQTWFAHDHNLKFPERYTRSFQNLSRFWGGPVCADCGSFGAFSAGPGCESLRLQTMSPLAKELGITTQRLKRSPLWRIDMGTGDRPVYVFSVHYAREMFPKR